MAECSMEDQSILGYSYKIELKNFDLAFYY